VEVLLRAYRLGREAPHLRHEVALALATLAHPKAATVFLQLSMNATAEQHFLSSVDARQAACPGRDQDLEALCQVRSLLKPPPPLLPAASLGNKAGRKAGRGAAAAAKRGKNSTHLLEGLEVWASEYLGSCAQLLQPQTAICAVAVLRAKTASGCEGKELLLLSRWSPGRFPILVQLPISPVQEDAENGQENSPESQVRLSRFAPQVPEALVLR